MADYVLVSGMGLGGWSWGQVWGHLTAPRERPPRLYKAHPVGQVVCWDPPRSLPSSYAQGTSSSLESWSSHLVTEIENRGLHSVVLV